MNVYIGWLGSTLKDITISLDDLFFPILTHWLALVFAVYCLLQYQGPSSEQATPGSAGSTSLRGSAGSMALRTVGKEIIILQIYYSRHFGAVYEGGHARANKFAFVASCLYLFVEETVAYAYYEPLLRKSLGPLFSGLFAKVSSYVGFASSDLPDQSAPLLPTSGRVDQSELIGHEVFIRLSKEQKDKLYACDNDTAYNVYMDMRKTLRKAIITFLGQAGLFLYYVYELNGGGDPDDPGVQSHDPNNCSVVKWFFAVTIIVVAGEDEIGPPFSYDYWRTKMQRVVRAAFEDPAVQKMNAEMNLNIDPASEDVLSDVFLSRLALKVLCRWPCRTGRDKVLRMRIPPLLHLGLRAFLDFSVNAFARCIIRGTAPIMLCVEGPLDFVKDVTAVFFIIKLDDIDSDADLTKPVNWDVMAEDSGYDLDTWTDPMYDINGLREVLGFPTDKVMVEQLQEKMAQEVAETEGRGSVQP